MSKNKKNDQIALTQQHGNNIYHLTLENSQNTLNVVNSGIISN